MLLLIKNTLILLFLLVLTITGCNQGNKPDRTFVEAVFNVDQALLSHDLIIDSTLNFSMQHPIKWQPIGRELAETLASGILVDQYERAEFLGGFMHPSDSALLMLLDVSAMDSSFFSTLQTNYIEMLNANSNWDQLQYEGFVYRSFYIDQYVMQNADFLHFKLVVHPYQQVTVSRPVAELLYFINAGKMADHITSVESSIGSLQYFNH